MSTKIIRLELSEKLWLNPNIKIHYYTPWAKQEKTYSFVLSRGGFWMVWRSHGIPCFHFHFLFGNTGKTEQLDENDFPCCYGKLFSKESFQKYLITAMFKVLFQQLKGTLTAGFERYFTIEDFRDMDHHRCWACSSEKVAPRQLGYSRMLLFLSNKPSV